MSFQYDNSDYRHSYVYLLALAWLVSHPDSRGTSIAARRPPAAFWELYESYWQQQAGKDAMIQPSNLRPLIEPWIECDPYFRATNGKVQVVATELLQVLEQLQRSGEEAAHRELRLLWAKVFGAHSMVSPLRSPVRNGLT
jgi:hypothetical protein